MKRLFILAPLLLAGCVHEPVKPLPACTQNADGEIVNAPCLGACYLHDEKGEANLDPSVALIKLDMNGNLQCHEVQSAEGVVTK
jgi:hypothetical protein